MKTTFKLNALAIATLVGSVTALSGCTNESNVEKVNVEAQSKLEKIWPKL